MFCIIEIPHFPAWIQTHIHKSKACVVVVENGSVVAFTPLGALASLRVGMSAERARGLLNEGLFTERNRLEEKHIWQELLFHINACTPYIESERAGLAIVNGLRTRSIETFIQKWRARAGWSDDRNLARLASIKAGLGNSLRIFTQQKNRFLADIEVEMLAQLAFSPQMLQLLQWYGLRDLGQVAALTQKHLVAQFGTEGRRLHELLHQVDQGPVREYHVPERIEKEAQFEPACRQWVDLESTIAGLVTAVECELGYRMCYVLGCVVHVVRGQPCRDKHVLKRPLHQADELYASAMHMLRKLPLSSGVERIQLHFSGLALPETDQAHLFRRSPLRRAIRAVQRRFPGSLRKVYRQAEALFPEEAYRLEIMEEIGRE